MRYLLACNFMQNMLTTTKQEMSTLVELVAGTGKGLTVIYFLLLTCLVCLPEEDHFVLVMQSGLFILLITSLIHLVLQYWVFSISEVKTVSRILLNCLFCDHSLLDCFTCIAYYVFATGYICDCKHDYSGN